MRRRRTERRMPLTDMKCRNARPGQRLRKLSDGGGLQLWIQPTGSRQWRLAYRFGGKQRLLALGPYPASSLADARERRDEARSEDRRVGQEFASPCRSRAAPLHQQKKNKTKQFL